MVFCTKAMLYQNYHFDNVNEILSCKQKKLFRHGDDGLMGKRLNPQKLMIKQFQLLRDYPHSIIGTTFKRMNSFGEFINYKVEDRICIVVKCSQSYYSFESFVMTMMSLQLLDVQNQQGNQHLVIMRDDSGEDESEGVNLKIIQINDTLLELLMNSSDRPTSLAHYLCNYYDLEKNSLKGRSQHRKASKFLKPNPIQRNPENQENIQDPELLTNIINALENSLEQRHKQYKERVRYLKEKIKEQENEGQYLNTQLSSLKIQMKETKEEAHQLMKRMKRVAESPYELIRPKRKTKKNRSQTRSKSKKQYRL